MNTRLVALSLIVALAVSGVGTGLFLLFDSGSDYCAELGSAQGVFADDGTGRQLVNDLPTYRKLADAAPEDLRDEWQILVGAIFSLGDAIADAGIKPSDYVNGEPPAGLPEADQAAIRAAASALSSPDMVAAAGGIDQQARDVCKIQLGL